MQFCYVQADWFTDVVSIEFEVILFLIDSNTFYQWLELFFPLKMSRNVIGTARAQLFFPRYSKFRVLSEPKNDSEVLF